VHKFVSQFNFDMEFNCLKFMVSTTREYVLRCSKWACTFPHSKANKICVSFRLHRVVVFSITSEGSDTGLEENQSRLNLWFVQLHCLSVLLRVAYLLTFTLPPYL